VQNPDNEMYQIKKLIPEKELLELLEISRWTLEKKRQEGLPYIELGKGKRVYHEESLVKWLLDHEQKG
jgi:hypothetical protein